MNDLQLKRDANAVAREITQLIEQYRANAPQPPAQSEATNEELQRREMMQHAQQLQRHTQNLWTEFNETYRDHAIHLLQAFEERGFETRGIQMKLQQGGDPRAIEQLVTVFQSLAAEMDTE